MSSSFEDALNAIVDQSEEEQRERDAVDRAFLEEWREVQERTLAPIFRETVHLLRQRGQNAHYIQADDDSAVLVVRRSELKFHAETEKRRILCSGPDPLRHEGHAKRRQEPLPAPRAFAPAELTRERVEQEVEDFVRAAVKPPPASTA
jgi:hypothetical protein